MPVDKKNKLKASVKISKKKQSVSVYDNEDQYVDIVTVDEMDNESQDVDIVTVDEPIQEELTDEVTDLEPVGTFEGSSVIHAPIQHSRLGYLQQANMCAICTNDCHPSSQICSKCAEIHSGSGYLQSANMCTMCADDCNPASQICSKCARQWSGFFG